MSQGVPELIYYKFDSPGATEPNLAATPAGTNPAPITGATIGSTGQFGTALAGNGATSASNSVNTGWAPNLGTGNWTISMWLDNIPSSSSLQYFFGDVNTATFRAFTNGVAGAGGLRLVGGGITAIDLANVFGNGPVVIHYVHDAAAGTIKSYVNGVLKSTSTQMAVNLTGTGPFMVGGYPGSKGLPNGGLMDEFRVYNRALSQAEISASWNVTLPLTVSPNDGGVTAFTLPVSQVTPGNQNIQVKIKNYGTGPLTSAQIGWKVGSTMGAPFAFTGNLATNAESAPITIGSFNIPVGLNKITAWVQNPNGATDGNHFNDTASVNILACNMVSGTFTINKNTPPSATNFQSFSTAIQSLTSCGINGPVIFNVAQGSGPYNEQVLIPAIQGTNATNTITFNGNDNTVSANPTGNLGIITLDGANHVKFDNFTITLDAAATAGWGFQFLNAADNNTISNNTINLPTNATGSNLLGIGTGVTASTYGNHTNNSRIQNNTINGGYYGIRMNGTSATVPANSNEITGNQVKDAYYYGIYLYYTANTLIEGNEISRLGRTDGTTFYGLYHGYSKSNTISKNRIHGIGGVTAYGIYYNYSVSPAGAEAMIKNNLIYDFYNTGATTGMHSIGSDGSHFFHNTIDLRNTVNTGTVHGFNQGTAATNTKFQNNIIAIDGGVSGAKYAVYNGVATSAFTSNNNVLYTNNGANTGYFSSAKATLADWQTASSQDANSVSADPMFVNLSTGILSPTNAPLNGIGAALIPPVTEDITGATRSTTIPDPGAYEFSPASNDAGISALISPTSPVQPGVNQLFQVTLKNYGSSPLTSATITATIAGTTTQTIAYNWTGNLVKDATSNVTIGNFTFLTDDYTVNVCTSAPNGGTDANPGNDCLITPIISCTPIGGVYTIDKNNPTAGTNFNSLTDAANRVSRCGITGPVTFNVVAGTGPYNEQLLLGVISGASATNTVTFNGNGNTISANPGNGTLGAVTLDGAKFVTIDNFVLTLDAAATAGWGVQFLNAADNNTISNNTINLPLSNTSSFIGICTGITYAAYGNHTNNSRIQNNTINGGYIGIRILGTSATATSTGNQITGNQVKDDFYYGIYLYYTDNTLIENNNISCLGSSNGNTFYALYNGYSKSNIISKNRIHGIGATTAYGIYNNNSDSPVGAEGVIKNNLIYDFTSTGTTYALYTAGSNGSYFFHNTVDLRNNGTIYGFYQTTAATNLKFQNNIISIGGGISSFKFAVYYDVTSSTIISNNNDLFVTNGANAGYYSGDKATLADWQTASSQDANSVSADPVFINVATGNLQPTSGTVNNIGTVLTPAVTDDILGNPRSATTPDLGAYEFTQNPNDVGITAISGPASSCGLTATEAITVTIKNFGTITQTTIPVSYSINGVNQTATPEIWTGSLAPNVTATHTFAAPADLSAANFYNLVATTNYTGDANAGNDTDTLGITNALIAGLPLINFETATTGINALRILTKAKSNVSENAAASLPLAGQPATSTKGMIMEGTTTTGWLLPGGLADPWSMNPDFLSVAYLCFAPQGAANPGQPLWLAFDLKQSFSTANANTNFRVTIDNVQVGITYRPPFTGGPAAWEKIYIDLSPYLNRPTIQIGLESSVSGPYANGSGPGNLIDNIRVLRANPTGITDKVFQSSINVYPNPSNGVFTVNVPAAKAYTLEVTDLTGSVISKEVFHNSNSAKVDLKGQAQGVYLLKITSEGTTAVQKLILE